jgi:hypothetical protein
MDLTEIQLFSNSNQHSLRSAFLLGTNSVVNLQTALRIFQLTSRGNRHCYVLVLLKLQASVIACLVYGAGRYCTIQSKTYFECDLDSVLCSYHTGNINMLYCHVYFYFNLGQ